jgi:cyclic pyranopterin phosphate synthase
MGNRRVKMVDVGSKPATHRIAVAWGRIRMTRETFERISSGTVPKGDPLEVARVAGIAAAKRTSDILPLCHPLSLTRVDLECDLEAPCAIRVTARVEAVDRTGVEMEAMTAVAAACLCVYDMCKSLDRAMVIEEILLLEKSGGKSGHFKRK